MWFWHLSHMLAKRVQTALCICASEPSLLAYAQTRQTLAARKLKALKVEDTYTNHARIQKVFRGESNLENFFLRWWVDPYTTLNGPPSARQWNATLAFRTRTDDGPTFNAGLVALCFSGDPDQYCKETLYFVIFRGEGSGPLSPTLDLQMPTIRNAELAN